MTPFERLSEQQKGDQNRQPTARILPFVPDLSDDPMYSLPTLPKIERERLRMELNNLDIN